ncbi:MAG: DUF2155 domain-containing protein [Candidatus Puniceispirillaceae bacterium]
MNKRFAYAVTGLFLASASPVTADTWLESSQAKLQTLDKITARISSLDVALNVPERFGTLEITVLRCAYRPPEEPPEDAAYLTVRDVGHDRTIAPVEVFSGWVFSSSPAISGLEHAVYDVTLITCLR